MHLVSSEAGDGPGRKCPRVAAEGGDELAGPRPGENGFFYVSVPEYRRYSGSLVGYAADGALALVEVMRAAMHPRGARLQCLGWREKIAA